MKRFLSALAVLAAICSPVLAQQTLPTLPAASTPYTGAELIYCVQGGVSSKCLISALGPGISSFTNMTITGSFTATGLVTNADLANPATTVNGATCTLGSSCTAAAAAGTLTGATLASGVTGSSLTSLGTLTSLGLSGVVTDTQAIGATSTDGLLLDNATAATVGAQKWSPRVHWSGMGWKTNATAGSQSVDAIEELQPVQGAASPSANLVWSGSINGGAYGALLTLSTGGGLNLASGTYQIGGSQIAFSNIASSLGCAQTPALTGDITSPAGSCATTLATVNSTPGAFGGANSIPTFTSNGKGLFTASGAVTPSIPFSELTGTAGAVTNADLANQSTTVNGATCTLGSTCSLPSGAAAIGTPANPGSTSSTTGVMMGLAGAITPANTGNVLMTINGDIDNNTTNDACGVIIRYGTGSAPGNGAANTGTTLGAKQLLSQVSGGFSSPYSVTGVAIGLTVGTPYWVDVELFAVTGGSCAITSNTVTLMEQ